MSIKPKVKLENKIRRQRRVRAKVSGTASRPRLSVYRSLNHIYGQLIDDEQGVTLVFVKDKELKAKGTKTEIAAQVGETLAQKAKAAGITQVVFDKGASQYHGRIKALADGARKGGLKF